MELYFPALIAAIAITLVEMTEVVALVFALGSDHGSIRPGSAGAVAGTATVSVIALLSAAVLVSLPRDLLLWASAIVLVAFGLFLLRSTVRTYRRLHAPPVSKTPTSAAHAVQFAGGFSIGAVEAIETVIVLIALAAAGYGLSALVGAAIGGIVLVGAAAVLHERVRKIKVPLLKLGATSLLLAFAVFWAGEAAAYPWPEGDLVLIPLFVLFVLIVRGVVALLAPAPSIPLQTNR